MIKLEQKIWGREEVTEENGVKYDIICNLIIAYQNNTPYNIFSFSFSEQQKYFKLACFPLYSQIYFRKFIHSNIKSKNTVHLMFDMAVSDFNHKLSTTK